ncbi:MAG: hypothetical protein ACI4ND_04065 [Succinivibrio sp.]
MLTIWQQAEFNTNLFVDWLMTLQDIITKITEAENSLCRELEKDDLGFSQDYMDRIHELLKEFEALKPTLSDQELETAKEFAKAYGDHIREQVKLLAVERAKVSDEYHKAKSRHAISKKYSQFKKQANTYR